MIQVNGTIELAQPIDAALQKAIVEMVRATRAEEGCIDYSFARDLADPNVLVVFERWRDRDALQTHAASSHMADFQAVMRSTAIASRRLRVYETDEGAALG